MTSQDLLGPQSPLEMRRNKEILGKLRKSYSSWAPPATWAGLPGPQGDAARRARPSRNCRSAQQSHARCDCESENTLAHGRDRLYLLLKQLGWKLTSDYKGFFKEVRLECAHGKPFSRIAGNIKSKSKCECAGSSSTGAKYIYVQKTGFLVAVSLHGVATRVGIFKKLADAKQARDKFLRSHGAMSRLQKGRGGHRD